MTQFTKKYWDDGIGKEACGIYAVIDKEHNIKYIGQTQKRFVRRWGDHLSIFRSSKANKLANWARKHEEELKFVILETCSPEVLDEREKSWIATCGGIENLLNVTCGGDVNPMDSPEVREKHLSIMRSEYQKEIRRETLRKFHDQRNPFRRNWGPKFKTKEERAEYFRKLFTGKKMSEDVKKRASERSKGEKGNSAKLSNKEVFLLRQESLKTKKMLREWSVWIKENFNKDINLRTVWDIFKNRTFRVEECYPEGFLNNSAKETNYLEERN